MQTVNAQFYYRSFTDLHHLFFNLALRFIYYFLNPCRVYASIGYQSLQRKSGYFPAQGIETGKNNRFGGVIHNQVNTGCSFNSPDISSFSTNNLAFDFITFEVKNSN